MDYSKYEQDYPERAFKDRRKKKCNGVKGKNHKWDHIAGDDCQWVKYAYPWMSRKLYKYVCQCVTKCTDCGQIQRNYNGRLCMHKDWKNYTKPEGAWA